VIPTVAPSKPSSESLLVLSDVHLGSDLNDHPQPEGFGKRSRRVDRDLVRMIDHYRLMPPPSGARWRIVFAGDFVDFIGIAIIPSDEALTTEPSSEEREHGLGNSCDHALAKLRRVGVRHADVFAALAAFLADGHAMTIVHGNHDVEFHWDTVQTEMRALVAAHAASPEIAASITERIDFAPLFFWAEGVAYIEHGHQYDAMCANEHPLMPLSPLDPRRIARGFCDVLLRFVVRPTRGLREHGHENMGIFGYLAFGVGLGARGLLQLGVSFFRAIVEMFRLRNEWIGEGAARAKSIREEHQRRLAAFALARRMDLSRITALLALQERPIIRTIHGILGTLLIDRLALALTSIVALAIVGAFAIHHLSLWFVVAALLGAWGIAHRYLARQRKLDPDDQLRERAGRLAKLFPAAFVVMGHTHVPVKMPVAEGQATYINVGSWAEEEDQSDVSGGYKAARTHLVIHAEASGPVAEFLTWESETGPTTYRA
jgi:UDP-2,3-diacylglucosamine pyrophosphatase LpxH